MAWLIQDHGPEPGRIYHLRETLSTIGRGESNEITILDGQLSRRHAMIRYLDENYILDDMNSANGVYVNGERLQRRVLRQGDAILMGTTRLVFSLVKPRQA